MDLLERLQAGLPNDPAVPSWHALVLGQAGRGVETMAEARAIAPELLPRAFEARTLLLLGRTAEYLALDLGPHAGLRAVCLWQAGRRAGARAP